MRISQMASMYRENLRMCSINARNMMCTMKNGSRAVRVKTVWKDNNREHLIGKMTLVTMT